MLLLDVLEHLKSPETILDQCHDVLAAGGLAVISLPNVANITVRLSLLFGRFRYTDRGILDRTHLRFFTRGERPVNLWKRGVTGLWKRR